MEMDALKQAIERFAELGLAVVQENEEAKLIKPSSGSVVYDVEYDELPARGVFSDASANCDDAHRRS